MTRVFYQKMAGCELTTYLPIIGNFNWKCQQAGTNATIDQQQISLG
jgi:hypothetical protein